MLLILPDVNNMKYNKNIVVLFLFALCGCNSRENGASEKITFINIQNASRKEIAKAILALASHKPKIIGINAIFSGRNEATEDSALYKAIKAANNVILISNQGRGGNIVNSDSLFTSACLGQGLLDYGLDEYGRVNRYRPYVAYQNTILWSFPVSVVSYSDLEKGEELMQNIVPNRYYKLKKVANPSESISIDSIAYFPDDNFNNRIILMGYLGPDKSIDNYSIVLEDGEQTKFYSTIILGSIIKDLQSGEKQTEFESAEK